MPPYFCSMGLCPVGAAGDVGDRTKLCLPHSHLVPCSEYVTLFEPLKADGTNSHDVREEPEQ